MDKMCEWGTNRTVEVTMPPYSPYHPTEWKKKVGIDSCIADIIQVFEDNNVRMLASCCGHGKGDGNILLSDMTQIVIPIELTTNKLALKR